MKKIVLVIVFSFIFVGCTVSESDGNDTKMKFDIDVYNLNYTLPSYTKLCIPDRKQACSSDGCEDIQPTVFLAYDDINGMIYRCDTKPCDAYEVEISQSGLYTYVEPIEPRGFTVKISSDNEYVETVSFGMTTLVSYGFCR
ncbi:hypothetical protein HOC54_01660 [Candidatus Peregrinibacteria bacterium]|jgi:hypothetical protein|nr:hypothetical protein [Candidatus Peregrinibacteria bacterium]